MKKAELIRCLACVADDSEVVVWHQGGGELEIIRLVYQESMAGTDAFTYIVAGAHHESPRPSGRARSGAPPDHEFDENGECKWCPAELSQETPGSQP